MITLLNLLSGCLALYYVLVCREFELGFMLVCLAAIFDFCDGLVARLTGSYSNTGKELDSLADVVSFGVVPASILFALAVQGGAAEKMAFPLFIVAGFAALRLAKFNVDESQKDTFVGLPTPAMAIFVSSGAWIIVREAMAVDLWVLYATGAVLSFLMVCNIEMFALKFASYGIKGNEIRYGFIAVSIAALLLLGVLALPFIIASYVLVSGLIWLLKG